MSHLQAFSFIWKLTSYSGNKKSVNYKSSEDCYTITYLWAEINENSAAASVKSIKCYTKGEQLTLLLLKLSMYLC